VQVQEQRLWRMRLPRTEKRESARPGTNKERQLYDAEWSDPE